MLWPGRCILVESVFAYKGADLADKVHVLSKRPNCNKRCRTLFSLPPTSHLEALKKWLAICRISLYFKNKEELVHIAIRKRTLGVRKSWSYFFHSRDSDSTLRTYLFSKGQLRKWLTLKNSLSENHKVLKVGYFFSCFFQQYGPQHIKLPKNRMGTYVSWKIE